MISLFSASVAGATGPLYGLALHSNAPATFDLVQVSAKGDTKAVGPAHKELFGCGDLVAVANGMLFYLGDTSSGATLVALNLTDGTEVCSKPVALPEVGYVGVGQSLDYDSTSDTLVLSGLNTNKTAHAVYRSSAKTCGPFTLNGSYGMADYLPMMHASSLDADGQRLFVLVAPGKQSSAVGVIDLTGKAPMKVIAEGAPDPSDTLLSMHWDAKSSRLVGIAISSDQRGLEVHSLDPTAQKWEAARKVTGVPKEWNTVMGNDATASTFDAAGRSLIFIAATQDEQGDVTTQYLASVDVDTAALGDHPTLALVGLGGSGLEALEMAGDEVRA